MIMMNGLSKVPKSLSKFPLSHRIIPAQIRGKPNLVISAIPFSNYSCNLLFKPQKTLNFAEKNFKTLQQNYKIYTRSTFLVFSLKSRNFSSEKSNSSDEKSSTTPEHKDSITDQSSSTRNTEKQIDDSQTNLKDDQTPPIENKTTASSSQGTKPSEEIKPSEETKSSSQGTKPSEEIKPSEETKSSELIPQTSQTSEDATKSGPKTWKEQLQEIFNVNNLSILLLPGILVLLVGTLVFINKSTNIEQETRYNSIKHYALSYDEVYVLRYGNRLSISEVYKLKKQILEDRGYTLETEISFDDFLKQYNEYLNRKFLLNHLLERLVNDLQTHHPEQKFLTLKQWLYVLSMLSDSNHVDRMVFCFSMLDSDDDSRISRTDVTHFLQLTLDQGWCYTPELIRRVRRFPPKWEILPRQEFVQTFIAKNVPQENLDFEQFVDIPFRLI